MINQTAAGNGDWCMTAFSDRNPDHWILVTWEHLNFAFPFNIDPTEVIAKLPIVPYVEIVESESSPYLTLAHGADESLPSLAEFVVNYAATFLKDPVTTNWVTKEESLYSGLNNDQMR